MIADDPASGACRVFVVGQIACCSVSGPPHLLRHGHMIDPALMMASSVPQWSIGHQTEVPTPSLAAVWSLGQGT